MQTFPELTLVIGGAASGKSRWAETLAESWGLKRVYVATAEAHDTEMAAKIKRHQDRRQGWSTIEAPLDLAPALGPAKPDSVVLIDCLTLWLSNHLLAGNDPLDQGEILSQSLAACRSPVILVSNDVGQSVVPENRLARRFQTAQGRLNQHMARQADLVVSVMAGLPLVLKGRVPD